MGLLVLGFIFVARRLKMADRQSLGFGLPCGQVRRRGGQGACCFGALLMMPAVLTMIALDMRELAETPLASCVGAR